MGRKNQPSAHNATATGRRNRTITSLLLILLGGPTTVLLEPISKLEGETLSVSFERHGINERRYFQGFCMLLAVDACGQRGFLIEH